MAPTKQHKNKRPSLADAFEGLDISPQPRVDDMPSRNLIRSIRNTIRARSLRGVEASFTIAMDEAYDYNILGDDVDPDDLHKELMSYVEEFTKFMQKPPTETDAFDKYLGDTLARMVFSSNMIESAGGGLDITLKLCQAVFKGEPIPELQERDADYEALKRDLIRQNLPHGIAAVLRSRREIVHHAHAASYIFDKVCVKDNDLSEEIILETHRILTHQIDTEQGMSWTQYSGVYRQCDVCAGLNQFTDPLLVPGAMRAMIRSLNEDLRDALGSGEIDPVALAAKYSHTFVNIHPFVDGNGRVCRLILNAILLKYSGVLVCIGEQGYDREKYLEIAAAGSMAEATAQDDMDGLDEHHKPKHYKGLASFTLKHARDSMRKLTDLLKKKQG